MCAQCSRGFGTFGNRRHHCRGMAARRGGAGDWGARAQCWCQRERCRVPDGLIYKVLQCAVSLALFAPQAVRG